MLLAGFVVVGLAMSRPGIGNPWFWDDLHWIRSYSLSELASTWHGTNEPQGIEVPGYRPLHAASNFARYELFGESAAANRYVSVGSLALAFALLVSGLRMFGVSIAIGTGAALLALTSKDLTYTYAWVSDGYQAVHMAAFGGAVLTLALGLRGGRRSRTCLGSSVALWLLTLFLKDQGLLLLPVLVLLALVGAMGGFTGIGGHVGAVTARTLGASASSAWAKPGVRPYVLAVVAVALGDVLARTIFVPDADPPSPQPSGLLLTLAQTVTFPGTERLSSAVLYSLLALVVFAFTTLALAAGRVRGAERVSLWLIAMFGVVAVASTTVYGFQAARADLVFFPVFFYGVFLCSSVALAAQILSGRMWTSVAVATVLLVVVTVTASVRSSVALQHSMSRWSVQTLARNYELVYGEYAGAKVPRARRAALEGDLARVGIYGRLPHDAAFRYLYCRALQDPGFPGRIPGMFAWGRKALPAVRCSGSEYDAGSTRSGNEQAHAGGPA